MTVEILIPHHNKRVPELTSEVEQLAHFLTIGYCKPIPGDMPYPQILPWVLVHITSDHNTFNKTSRSRLPIKIPQEWFEITYDLVNQDTPFYKVWFNLNLLKRQAQSKIFPRSTSLVAQAAGMYLRFLTHAELKKPSRKRGSWTVEDLETLWGLAYLNNYPLLESSDIPT